MICFVESTTLVVSLLTQLYFNQGRQVDFIYLIDFAVDVDLGRHRQGLDWWRYVGEGVRG